MQMSFPSFDDLRQVKLPAFHPISKIVAALSDADRSRLIDRVRALLTAHPDGSVSYSSRANAIKARVPS